MVDELSALGLRHVGYNVPVEFFGPFVNACIDTLEGKASAEVLATCRCRHSQLFGDFLLGLQFVLFADFCFKGNSYVNKMIQAPWTHVPFFHVLPIWCHFLGV